MKNCCLYLLAIVSLLGFLSCSKDDVTEKDARKEVKVTATFNGLSVTGGVTTRAVDNSWEAGDAIGLFMKTAGTTLSQSALANNARYTTDVGDRAFANSSTNKVYFPFDKSNVDFISYYPYTDNLNGLIYKVDVSDQSNLGSIDLMYADNVKAKNYTAESIELDFKHQFTKVVLKIENNNSDNTNGEFSAKIINAPKSASFSLVDGALSVDKELVDILFNINKTTNTAEAILLPVTDLSNKEFLITIGDISYSYSLSKSTDIKSFAPATKCEYNITIEPNSGRVLSNVTATITDWTTVSENITADEVPVADADGGNTEPGGEVTPPVDGGGGEGGGGSTEPGEGDNPTEPGEGDDPVLPDGGDGTFENPYSIAEAKELTEGKGIWVKGYIVGSYGAGFNSFTNVVGFRASQMNLALADSVTVELYVNTFPVDIFNDGKTRDFQDLLNLNNNSNNLGRKIVLMGDIGEWKNTGPQYMLNGIENIKNYFFKNEEPEN